MNTGAERRSAGVRRLVCLVVALSGLCLAATVARAQEVIVEKPSARNSITGGVQLDRKGLPTDRLLVTLTPDVGGGHVETWTDLGGRFFFESVPAGNYTVAVRAPYGSLYDDGAERVTLYEGYTSTNYNVVVTLKLRDEAVVVDRAPSPPTIAVDANLNVPAEARKLWTQGVAAGREGKNDRAVELFKKALAIDGDFVAALNDLGAEYLRRRDFGAARPLLEHATELDPNFHTALMNLALVLFEQKEFTSADDYARRALAITPGLAPALLITGEVALMEGRTAEAIDRLKRAVEIGGEAEAAAWLTLGRAYEAAGQRNDAFEAYRMVVALEPGSARAALATERLNALHAPM